MPPRNLEVSKDQGYYEHALLDQDRPPEGPFARRVRPVWRLFCLVAGLLAGALLLGLFLWIFLAFR